MRIYNKVITEIKREEDSKGGREKRRNRKKRKKRKRSFGYNNK